jgi:hypothetical protein
MYRREALGRWKGCPGEVGILVDTASRGAADRCWGYPKSDIQKPGKMQPRGQKSSCVKSVVLQRLKKPAQ